MTIEELQAENDKLNARLQKAITVFAEQKANITRLTEERDSVNTEVDRLKKTVSELEAKVSSASENDDKFFEQLQEIDTLKTKIVDKDITIERIKEEKEAQVEQVKSLTADLDKAQSDIVEKDATIEKSREIWRENKAEIDKLHEEVANMGETCEDLTSQNNALSDKVNELTEALNDMTDRYNNAISTVKNTISDFAKIVDTL